MKHSVEEVKLANGAEGLLIDVPNATVMSFQFQFRAGNRYVRSKDIYEAAHIMEHMAFGANSQLKSEEFQVEFAKNGASHNAATSDLAMTYIAHCADFEWDRILGLYELAICEPKYTTRGFAAEKGNVKNELTGYLNSHQHVLWPKMQQLLGEDVLTFWQSLQTIPQVTLADIREHHKRTHTAKNLRFVIAGKLSGRKAEIRRRLESWNLPAGERFEVPQDELSSGNPTLIRRKEASNLTFGWSMVIPRVLTDDEEEAMECLNHILTGTMHSRIFGAARKKGLAYDMFSGVSVGTYSSSWDFGGEVNIETAQPLFEVITREMKHVAQGRLKEEELEAAKSYALGQYQMGAQTVSQISAFYSGRYFADGIVKSYDKVPDAIRRITRQRMTNTAQSFIEADIWALAGVSSCEKEQLIALNDKLTTIFKVE